MPQFIEIPMREKRKKRPQRPQQIFQYYRKEEGRSTRKALDSIERRQQQRSELQSKRAILLPPSRSVKLMLLYVLLSALQTPAFFLRVVSTLIKVQGFRLMDAASLLRALSRKVRVGM